MATVVGYSNTAMYRLPIFGGEGGMLKFHNSSGE